jgi:hypothetical protein
MGHPPNGNGIARHVCAGALALGVTAAVPAFAEPLTDAVGACQGAASREAAVAALAGAGFAPIAEADAEAIFALYTAPRLHVLASGDALDGLTEAEETTLVDLYRSEFEQRARKARLHVRQASQMPRFLSPDGQVFVVASEGLSPTGTLTAMCEVWSAADPAFDARIAGLSRATPSGLAPDWSEEFVTARPDGGIVRALRLDQQRFQQTFAAPLGAAVHFTILGRPPVG